MNVFIATTQTQDLLKGEDQIWTYCLRREPLQKFIKEQYGKLVTLKPKIFVIDLRAFDSPSDLPLLIHSFPSAKYLIIVPAGQKFRMQHCIPFPEGKGLLKYLKEGPQQKKIGIISEEETDATALVAFQLISCLAREQGNLCYIEVGKNARLPERAEKFHLTKTEYGYEYNSIPFYSNLAKDTEISVFDFGKRDAAKENMLRRCDIPLIVGTEKGRKIRIKRGDQEAVIKIPKDPFRPELMDDFQNFIPEIDFGVTEKNKKDIQKKDKKNPGSREKKTRKREKIPTSEKKESKNKRSKKLNVHKPDIQKFRRKITKKQFLILVFSLAVLSVGAATIRIQSAQKKETKVKEAVQEKQKEQHPEPTQASSEKQTEKSTEKRKSTKKKEKTTTASATSESGSYPVTTTSRSSSGRTSKQSTTRRSVVTTRKKRKVTTTRKPRPTTTRKPKPTTTERFDVNYGPE